MADVLHINPIVGHLNLLHGKRGAFFITRYANGFEIWRQTAKPEEIKNPLAWMEAMGAITRLPNNGLRLVRDERMQGQPADDPGPASQQPAGQSCQPTNSVPSQGGENG